MLSRLRDRPWLTAVLLAVAAQTLFSWELWRPTKLTFDEVHYVPAAQTLLALAGPTNTEHPLLGKELIALGILLFGDNPIGWRALSTLAGTATVLGTYWLLFVLFGRTHVSAFGAVLVAINQTVYVQARIGMLDGFLGAFVVPATAAMLWAMRAPVGRVRWRLVLAGILLGCATAVKWTAAPYVAFACLSPFVWRGAGRWGGTHPVAAALIVGGVAVATYFATFAPAFFYARDAMTFADLLPFQQAMYERQTQILSPHPYQSDWWTWPVLARPIWYFYEADAGAQRGILLIGNPAIMWGGLVAVAVCLWTGIRRRAPALVGPALLWIVSVAIWAAIPKSLGFYYYYHLSGIWLCVALAAAFQAHAKGRLAHADEWFLVPALALFGWFWPILSAAPLSGPGAFNRWMWFDSWR